MLWVTFSIVAAIWLLFVVGILFGPELADVLIRRAKRTPYYHLTGYMNRWWLVPYRDEVVRQIKVPFLFAGRRGMMDDETNDGTGPVAFRKRPIAWLFQRFHVSVRVHEILRGDLDRHPHDHPFSYLTIILRGRYIESQFDSTGKMTNHRLRGPGSIMWRPIGSWHLLDLPAGPVTTLFFTGRKLNGVWGFNVDGVKLSRRAYEKLHGRPW